MKLLIEFIKEINSKRKWKRNVGKAMWLKVKRNHLVERRLMVK
jgi:hypothetical protein